MHNKAPVAVDGLSLGHPRWWPAPPPAALPATVSLELGYIWLLLLAFLNFGHLQKQSLPCVHFFLLKSEDYYSILSLSPRNWEGWLLLGGITGFSFFSLQFSQSQHFSFQCSPGSSLASQPCLSPRCHAHLWQVKEALLVILVGIFHIQNFQYPVFSKAGYCMETENRESKSP